MILNIGPLEEEKKEKEESPSAPDIFENPYKKLLEFSDKVQSKFLVIKIDGMPTRITDQIQKELMNDSTFIFEDGEHGLSS